MYHLHTLRHMSYVYLQIFLTRQGNTLTIEVIFLCSGCGRVVQCAGHKAKRLVLQCINGVSSNPVEDTNSQNQLWLSMSDRATLQQIFLYVSQIILLTTQVVFTISRTVSTLCSRCIWFLHIQIATESRYILLCKSHDSINGRLNH